MGQISLSVGAPLENLAGGVIYQGPEKALEMGTFLHMAMLWKLEGGLIHHAL